MNFSSVWKSPSRRRGVRTLPPATSRRGSWGGGECPQRPWAGTWRGLLRENAELSAPPGGQLVALPEPSSSGPMPPK